MAIGRTIRKNLETGINDRVEYSAIYTPCSRAKKSADFRGVRQLDDGRVLFYFGDVFGHGDHMAQFAEKYSALVNAIVDIKGNELSAKYLSNELNSIILLMQRYVDEEISIGAPLATAFFAIYDPKGKRIDFSNGGHPYSLFFPDKDNPANFHTLKAENPPIATSDWDYTEETARIDSPNNLILLYSDGIVERTNDSTEFYGTERLVEHIRKNIALPLDCLVQSIYSDSLNFANALLEDDMSVMALTLR